MTFYSPKYYKELKKSSAVIDKPIYQENKRDAEVLRLAKNDLALDLLSNIESGYKDWLDAGNEGSREDYLVSLSLDELKTLSLKDGGPVDKYNRPKEPVSVKKIDLTDELLKTADMFSRLSSEEIKTINWMLKKMGKKD